MKTTREQRKEFRRLKLIELIDTHYAGSQASFSEAAGIVANLVSRYVLGSKGIGEDMRYKIESNTGYAGWFNEGDIKSELIHIDDNHPEFIAIRRVEFKLSAGVSGYEIEYLNGHRAPIFFRNDFIANRRWDADKIFAVEVSGKSMEPNLFEGDVVIVNTADVTPIDGEPYAINFEGELVIKRLIRDMGEWLIRSDNQDKARFPDKRCNDRTSIIGRIVYRQTERI